MLGNPFPIYCPSCRESNEPANQHCVHCGASLLAPSQQQPTPARPNLFFLWVRRFGAWATWDLLLFAVLYLALILVAQSSWFERFIFCPEPDSVVITSPPVTFWVAVCLVPALALLELVHAFIHDIRCAPDSLPLSLTAILCSGLSVWVFPPLFGAMGILLGAFGAFKRGHLGWMAIPLAVACMLVGIAWGVRTWVTP